ncbi:MAG TPA: CDP-alcohol phosphatidyltransferase family protein [Candidatus Dormibacteraeota bacterium]|nr:CDP-alcohol phosphatidyltransferase family protein [Candidatus Dormibacteraeota bacterium]
MATDTYQPTERRPIASRERPIWQKAASLLANAGFSANAISVFGMVVGMAAGAALAATSFTTNTEAERALWLAGAAGIQLRLLANMLDGMVAIARHEASPLGELFNELPDRVSDIAIIIGAGYATGGSPLLGYLATCVAVLTAYVRAVGKAAGASNLFLGPMAKPHRMFTLTVVSVAMGLLPATCRVYWGQQRAGWAALGLSVIIVGGAITILRRLGRIVRHLKGAQ